MAMLTVRNLPQDIHSALKLRAAQHGRSTEAEVRAILEEAVKPEARLRLGSALAALGQGLGQGLGLSDDDLEALVPVQDGLPAQPMSFPE